MTLKQYVDSWLENSKYKDKYKRLHVIWNKKQEELRKQWEEELQKRSEIGDIPEKVIRSYVAIHGEQITRHVFRGKRAKGLQSWEETQIKKLYREGVRENLANCK